MCLGFDISQLAGSGWNVVETVVLSQLNSDPIGRNLLCEVTLPYPSVTNVSTMSARSRSLTPGGTLGSTGGTRSRIVVVRPLNLGNGFPAAEAPTTQVF